jgi:trigger factor
MQMNIEILNGLERKIIVKTPSEEINQAVEKRLNEVASTFKLPGFRPGKVPMHLLRQRFGDSIRYEVIEKVIESTYHEALSQEKLEPAGAPNIKVLQDKAGEPLEYEALFEVYPAITLNSLASAEIEFLQVDVTQKDIDEMVLRLRRQKAKWEETDKPAKKGDRLTISFEGRQDGELFEGGSAKEVVLELGMGTTIPGFEDGFIGHKTGDEIEIKVNFPQDYRALNLAGKPAEFKAMIHKVEVPELPTLDDEFAKEFGVKEGGVDTLHQKVSEQMQNEVKQKIRAHMKGQVLEKLLELNAMDLPNVLVEQELKDLQTQEQDYLQRIAKEQSKQPILQPRKALSDLARRRVQLGLLFRQLIKNHHITASREKVDQLIEEITAVYDEAASTVAQMYRENRHLYEQLQQRAIEDQIIDLLISQAKQIEKIISYSELTGLRTFEEDQL